MHSHGPDWYRTAPTFTTFPARGYFLLRPQLLTRL
jgi:hypothetical protein